jgi:hypothetical protein
MPVDQATRNRSWATKRPSRASKPKAKAVRKVYGGDGGIIVRGKDGAMSKVAPGALKLSRAKVGYKHPRVRTLKTQRHSGERRLIISRITGWAGGEAQAMAWYRTQPISAFGCQTAETMVKLGKLRLVLDYLDGIALGGFA